MIHILMYISLNAGFGDPIAHEPPAIASYKFRVVRQDLFGRGDHLPALVAEFVGSPIMPLFLIGGGSIQHSGNGRIEPHELAAWTAHTVDCAEQLGLTEYLLEIGNEPDLAHPDYSTRPQDFAEAVRQCSAAARDHGFRGTIISGGISNLNERGFTYLNGMISAGVMPPDIVIGFHRYPESGRLHLAPHRGYRSRQDEWDTLVTLTEPRAVACTEFGYSTFTDKRTRTDNEVAVSVLWDLQFYEDRGAVLAAVYQLNDGPDDTLEDRYGVRTFEGVWKPVANAIRNRGCDSQL